MYFPQNEGKEVKTPGFGVRSQKNSSQTWSIPENSVLIEDKTLVADVTLKSREDLKQLREKAKELVAARETGRTKVIVGMGTCGIAAGAREVMAAILEELNRRNVQATVTQTGCIGMCEKEPLVDVQRPGEKRITYGNVKPSDVPRIITGHVLHGHIVEDLVVARFEEI